MSDSLRKRALDLYTPPFKCSHGYIFDAKNEMVADNDGVMESVAACIRGWGRIQNLPEPEQLQDEVGQIVAEALTTYWTAAQPSAQAEPEHHVEIDVGDAPLALLGKGGITFTTLTKAGCALPRGRYHLYAKKEQGEPQQDAAIAAVVLRFIDRMNDVAPESGDPAERILSEFVDAVMPIFNEGRAIVKTEKQ